MKTLTLSLVLLAFAFASQAGEGKKCDKECADKAKAACCEKTTVKIDMSVKGAALLVKK